WWSSFLKSSRRQPPVRQQRNVSRLAVEALEDRTVPSTFLVTNTADSGPGSLRSAVLAANAMSGADAIFFGPRVHGTISLTSGELSITDDLTIAGPGTGDLSVSGNDVSRVFNIGAGSVVAIDGLTITHGRSTEGGGIINDGGTLSVSDMAFVRN